MAIVNEPAKKLLLFPDHGADPLWDLRSGAMIALEELPISRPTRAALRAWARRWEHLAAHDMKADAVEQGMMTGKDEPVPEEMWNDHEREGRQLWIKLLRELGPSWSVGWATFPDMGPHVQWTPDGAVEPLP